MSAARQLRVLDLFSGIGGFSLGLERAGMRTVAFCEIDPYCRAVLRKHWPNVPIHEDVRTFDGVKCDVICGGFPCQDISHVGGKAGIDGARSGLWSEFARLLGALRPSYAIVENVSALTVRGLGRVLGDMAALGFDAEWHCIPASSIGAPHQRDRIWIVAYPARMRREQGERAAEERHWLLRPGALDCPSPWSTAENNDQVRSRFIRIVDGIPNRVDRLDALGNAIVPQMALIIGNAIIEQEDSSGSRSIQRVGGTPQGRTEILPR